jgi:hypothetical protein
MSLTNREPNGLRRCSTHQVGIRGNALQVSGGGTRQELEAAIAFLDGALRWSDADLVAWFTDSVVRHGIMEAPGTVREAGAPVLALASSTSCEGISQLLASARARVVQSLAGLVAMPSVDAFVNAAIYAGRVQRASERGRSLWRATPQEHDTLSDIVLSLFATDVLSHRELYDDTLAVCSTCGRVTFDAPTYGKRGCAAHPRASFIRYKARPRTPAEIEDAERDELEVLRHAWSSELSQALRRRTGWSCVGSVEVVAPRSHDAFDGYTDEHRLEVPAGRSAAEVLAQWRRTPEGRFVERAVVHVNDALLERAPVAKNLEWLFAEWADGLDANAPIAVFGTPAELRRLKAASKESPVGARLLPCVASVQPGLAVALTGAGLACSVVAGMSFYAQPGLASVTIYVDVRAPPGGTLRRVDLSLA